MKRQEAEDFDILYKMIIIGDSGVGKTNILSRYTKDQFSFDFRSTVGVEFGAKKIEMYGIKIKNQIWDTAGQERYKSITSSYYKGAKGALVVYDITKRDTFINVSKWIGDLKMNGEKDVIIVLVGNKSDLNDDREVSIEEGIEFAKEKNVLFVETSAFKSVNIEKAFTLIVEQLLKDFMKGGEYEQENIFDGHHVIDLVNSEDYSRKKKGCCSDGK